jgi:ADP-ribose pyrophosphatase YjhB (NUDIX family)
MDPAACFNYCPRCGRAIDGAAGARPFRCGGCGFVYFFNAAVSVAAIILDGANARRALFIRRGHQPGLGKLAFAGGFVDPGERVETAVTREVREEVGLELTDVTWLGSFPNDYRYLDLVYPVADLFFVARAPQPDRAAALDGVADIVWLDPGDVDPQEIAFPSMRAALAQYVSAVRAAGPAGDQR